MWNGPTDDCAVKGVKVSIYGVSKGGATLYRAAGTAACQNREVGLISGEGRRFGWQIGADIRLEIGRVLFCSSPI